MSRDYCEVYNKTEHVVKTQTVQGTPFELRSPSLQLPKLIVRTHVLRQLSEPPTVAIKGNDDYEFKFNVENLLTSFLAYGTIFIVPYMLEDDTTQIDIVTRCNVVGNQITYFEKNGKLQLLKFVRRDKILVDGKVKKLMVFNEHYMEDGKYYYKQYYKTDTGNVYLNKNDGSKSIGDTMLPFKSELQINATTRGEPIYAIATDLIREADRTICLDANAIELEQPIVGVPEGVYGNTSKRDKVQEDKEKEAGNVRRDLRNVMQNNNLFKYLPGMKEYQELKYFGGNYDPKPYIERLNFLLHMISLNSGLGSKYLSYDKTSGLKTATEVIYDNHELAVNMLMINNSLRDMIKKIVVATQYLETGAYIVEDIVNVVFEDNVFQSRMEYIKNLTDDFLNGSIPQRYYLKEKYNLKEDELNEIIANTDVNR